MCREVSPNTTKSLLSVGLGACQYRSSYVFYSVPRQNFTLPCIKIHWGGRNTKVYVTFHENSIQYSFQQMWPSG